MINEPSVYEPLRFDCNKSTIVAVENLVLFLFATELHKSI